MSKQEIEILDRIKKLYDNRLYKDSLALLHSSIYTFPNFKKIAYFYNLKGLINLALKDWKACIEDFKNAISIDNNFYHAHFNLGLAYYDLGDLDKSYEQNLKVLEIDKNNSRAKIALIEILTFQ